MRIPFYNISIDVLHEKEVINAIDKLFKEDSPHSLFFINAHCFNLAKKNIDYVSAIKNASLVLNDGIGISIAGRIAGVKFPDNLNGTDLIPTIIKMGYEQNKRFYFLGTKDHQLYLAKNNLETLYPGIQIAGMHNGFFSTEETHKIINEINALKIDILIVGMGVPRQELWIHENISKLKTVKLCIAGGAILDFISGEIHRAPLWIRKIKMEWAFRLLLEPKRMWKRYLIGNLVFFYNLFIPKYQ